MVTASVLNGVSSITVKAAVSSKATWKLYSDKACKKVVSNNKLKLKVGANTAYLKVTAENGKTKAYTLKITRKAAEYETHIKLGVIGKKSYAETVAKIFKQEYDSANVKVQKKGKYYLVTMDFNNKTAAKIACEDMIRRKYIVNYYFE
ncbi:cadherin-like protein [Mobilisporobacter senegalensis]|uniref:Cadherin-like protein n=1 Tax=Mobilisporobacter senegalensis TaxID=1329262 RepID=A0A3N1XMC2_9FIRM|nr:cadherin-like beta sandwich domain-containing protein [Mobilisporobacter senegalensis]ROR25857.1 cadherin-like protein [Mobilisporobacter senegalensis]